MSARLVFGALSVFIAAAMTMPARAQDDQLYPEPFGDLYLSAVEGSYVDFIESISGTFNFYLIADIDFADLGAEGQNLTNGIGAWEAAVVLPADPGLFILSEDYQAGIDVGDKDGNIREFIVGTGPSVSVGGPTTLVTFNALSSSTTLNGIATITPTTPASYAGEVVWREFVALNGCTLNGSPEKCVFRFASRGSLGLSAGSCDLAQVTFSDTVVAGRNGTGSVQWTYDAGKPIRAAQLVDATDNGLSEVLYWTESGPGENGEIGRLSCLGNELWVFVESGSGCDPTTVSNDFLDVTDVRLGDFSQASPGDEIVVTATAPGLTRQTFHSLASGALLGNGGEVWADYEFGATLVSDDAVYLGGAKSSGNVAVLRDDLVGFGGRTSQLSGCVEGDLVERVLEQDPTNVTSLALADTVLTVNTVDGGYLLDFDTLDDFVAPGLLDVTRTAVDLGQVELGDVSTSTLRLTSLDAEPQDVVIDRPGPPFYVSPSGSPLTLEFLQTTDVTISFVPVAPGEYEDRLVFTGREDTLFVDLVGAARELPRCAVSADSVDFGATIAGVPVTRNVSIWNDGGGILSGFVEVDALDFDLVQSAGVFALAREETLTVTIEYDPFTAGPDAADLRVTSFYCEREISLAGSAVARPEFATQSFEVAGLGATSSVVCSDLDADRTTDLYLSRSDGPNVALRRETDGTWVPFPSPALLDAGPTNFALAWDVANDRQRAFLLLNEVIANLFVYPFGGSDYVGVPAAPFDITGSTVAAAPADVDGNGALDVFVSSASGSASVLATGVPGVAGLSAVELPALVDAPHDRSAVWCDFDGDGDPDLFRVVPDGADQLLVNDGGSFTTRVVPGLTDTAPTAAASWADVDNDGWFDLYVAYEGQPDRLYRNDRGTAFEVVEFARDDESVGKSQVTWIDYDNNGWLDLVLGAQEARFDVLVNVNGTLQRLESSIAPLDTISGASALVPFDVDDDGLLDLFMSHPDPNRADRIATNETIGPGNWLRLEFQGVASNGRGIGTRVRAVVDSVSQSRELFVVDGTGGQREHAVHFGVGAATTIDTLEIRWPSGLERIVLDVPVNQRLLVLEDEVSTDVPGSGTARSLALHPARPNPFNPRTEIAFDLPRSGIVNLDVFNLAGRRVRRLHDGELPAGAHRQIWNGTDGEGSSVASGVYLVRLIFEGEDRTQRVVLVR